MSDGLLEVRVPLQDRVQRRGERRGVDSLLLIQLQLYLNLGDVHKLRHSEVKETHHLGHRPYAVLISGLFN